MKKAYSWIFILVLLLSVGCSPFASGEKDEVKQAATDVEGMLREGPGKYGGDKYDESKVKAELERFPDNLSADEAYNRLIALLAEDYKPLVKQLDELNPEFQLSKTPGKKNTKEDAQAEDEGKPRRLNVEILMDASGSMAGRVSGGVKMDLAKKAIRNFVSQLPEDARVALRVYGHKGSNQQKDKALSCKSTEVVYPLGAYDESSFQDSLNQFRPTGWTPLAAAMEQAKNDLRGNTGENVENIIYVVSDGIETCGGDPVKAAKELHRSEIQAIVNIIGFDVDDAGQRALKNVAEAGGGTYQTASSGTELNQAFQNNIDELLSEIHNEIDWGLWDTHNRLDFGLYKKGVIEKLAELTMLWNSGFPAAASRENDRLKAAMVELKEMGKLQSGIAELNGALAKKIDHRYQSIKKYYTERNKEISKKLDELEEKIDREISEKHREGTK
ncbi:vWA domain-containing protein [Planifilum fimeticola]